MNKITACIIFDTGSRGQQRDAMWGSWPTVGGLEPVALMLMA